MNRKFMFRLFSRTAATVVAFTVRDDDGFWFWIE